MLMYLMYYDIITKLVTYNYSLHVSGHKGYKIGNDGVNILFDS